MSWIRLGVLKRKSANKRRIVRQWLTDPHRVGPKAESRRNQLRKCVIDFNSIPLHFCYIG